MPHGCATPRLLLAVLAVLVAAATLPAAASAKIAISDALVTEGDGPKTMTFIVTRTNPNPLAAPSVTFRTGDGTARAPGDYSAKQGQLRFSALGLSAQVQVIQITIAGDQAPEEPEAFNVVLTSASGGETIVRRTATGVIVDDDEFQPPSGRSTSTSHIKQQLIARSGAGGAPNAAVFEPVISGDARIARNVAYTSNATNIAGATDGHFNVFLVKRGGSPGKNGTPWKYSATALASRGVGGAAANGDSFAPAIGGWTHGDAAKRPRCLGFVSRASNLVAGDGNGRADGFVRRLPGIKLRRIAAPAAVSDIAVSGDCQTVALVAGGSLYVKRGFKKLRLLAGGGASAPDLTHNGAQVGYARAGKVFVRRTSGGGLRTLASGVNPSVDADAPHGKVRRVTYERGTSTFFRPVGGGERLIAPGSLPASSGGGAQALFAAGRYAYLYAISNNFGKKLPQGFCPQGQGAINGLHLSARGNYAVLSCSGGLAYLSFLGGK